MAAVLSAVSDLAKEGPFDGEVLTGYRELRETTGTVCWASLNSQGEQEKEQGWDPSVGRVVQARGHLLLWSYAGACTRLFSIDKPPPSV